MMKVFSFVCLCVIVSLVIAEPGTDVVSTLTSSNFDEFVKSNQYVLVDFYAPWCGHCKKLEPEFSQAATTLKGEVSLVAIDATVEKDLGAKYELKGYPTLKFFKNGVAEDYKGGRTADTIVAWLRKRTGPPAKTLTSADAVTAFAASAKVAVVGYFASDSSEEFKTFESVASKDDEVAYAAVFDAAVATAAKATVPSVVVHKTFDEGQASFTGPFDAASISGFVSAHRNPIVIPFSMDVVADIFQSKSGNVAFLFTQDAPVSWFNEVAKKFRGKLVFTTADASNDRLNQHVGITADEFPKFIILDTKTPQMKRYPLDGAPTEASVTTQIETYLAGTLKATYKSAPAPTDNDGPVKVVVGSTFEEIVLDESKDVLLEVYAPWCGHCKKLEPDYEKLGKTFAKNDKIVIAKMDGTLNEIEGLSWRGFPTIKYYPAGKKDRAGTDYNGGREFDDFVTFLESNSKHGENHDEL